MSPEEEFVKHLVQSIVNKPEAVEVERKEDEQGVLISLKVDPEDMSFVIGKQGKNAQALRQLLRVFGAKNDARVTLKILEPEK